MVYKDYLKNKAIGFWFSVGIGAFALVTAVVYVACYAGTDNINWVSFALMLAAFIVSAVLIPLNKFVKYLPYVQALLIFLSLLFFIYGIYYYVSVVAVGIDLDHFGPEFFVCVILFVIAIGVSIANVFLPQEKEKEKAPVADEAVQDA